MTRPRATRWTVAQIGAREHYAIPAGFQQQHSLRHLFTDAWCPSWLKWTARLPTPFRHFAARRSDQIPDSQVTAFHLQSIANRLSHSAANPQENYIRIGKHFAEQVTAHLRRTDLDPATDAFFSYNTGCLETLHFLTEKHIPTIVDQIDPARVEMEMIHQESQRWPGWELAPEPIPESYWQRLSAEWTAATRVLVNSSWSRDALIEQGVPPEKLFIVPVSYDPPPTTNRAPPGTSTGLNVLWLGTVCLRKGIPYLIEAARQLQSEKNIRFLIAGPIQISSQAIASAPPNIRFLNRIPRSSAPDLYRSADLFVIPTISDGFAITQLEAMAAGLPVIATPNCGQVVTDGIDGFIIPPADSAALACAILKLHADRSLLQSMSQGARQRCTQFSPAQHAQQITAAIETVRD